MDALVSPFPRELTTPPVTKMCLGTVVEYGVWNSEFGVTDRTIFGLRNRRVCLVLSTLDYRFAAKNVNERGNQRGTSALGFLDLQVEWISYGCREIEIARG